MRSLIRCVALCAVAMLIATPALAQSSASSLTGLVVDTGGGVIPGANVVLKNNATGTGYETVTNSAGAFSIPSIDPGVYTLTASLSGFKTAVVTEVRLLASRPGEVKVVMEVGALTETVEVKAATELVQTQSSTLTSTITTEQINNVLNGFDTVNYNPAFNPGGGNTIFTVTSGYTDINTTFDPGGRLGQIVTRFSW